MLRCSTSTSAQLRTLIEPFVAVMDITEFLFALVPDQGRRETKQPHTPAERRPWRSGSTGHAAGTAGTLLYCSVRPACGVTRDPRSRPTRSGPLRGSLLAGCLGNEGSFLPTRLRSLYSRLEAPRHPLRVSSISLIFALLN